MDWRQLPTACSIEGDPNYQDCRLPRDEAIGLGLIQEPASDEAISLSDLPEFQYLPLLDPRRSIRVLCLEGPRRVQGHHQETVPSASFHHFPLVAKLPFIALSYAWGNPEKKCPILLNDCLFWVTESLASALERFQEQDRMLPLWADAICINQEDLKEKGPHD
ncbi:uncharacterized protein BDZ99DRAFT_149695 [Mytilinidion resinicola]|uniref:Heterokaryon incompatibility domain-containing protein n=1 Tax=Mytilinidion resinicola TaxID=574789 RepID=A0A6A6Y745_9PEZI|nr:uncharacterized protein BDZ99DRAFT_149695 [Mytilinidion resinicola]KAF2804651.1 hypothetical protein BDZ99DRAFT_149695 [Mytilinidion resinicola]